MARQLRKKSETGVYHVCCVVSIDKTSLRMKEIINRWFP